MRTLRQRGTEHVRYTFFTLLLVVVSASVSAQAPALLAHRAIYDLALDRAASGSGVIGARGRLVMELADSCDGYTLNQRIRNELRQTGNDYIADLTVSTWEASDGSAFRFSSRHVVNDKTVEEILGRANGATNAGESEADFKKPSERKLVLPRETIFPTQHALLLLERAALGEKFVRATVFDGSSAEGLQATTAVILEHFPRGTYKGKGNGTLAQLESWRMQIAYFKIDTAGGDSQPEYEVAFRLFENGVSTDVTLDYGDFALKGVLKVFEPLPSNC